MHPSETEAFLLTRLLAYALNYEEGIQFSDGLSSPDDPSISLRATHGQILKWIDIGHPSARRLHKASKASGKVRVYTYKNPENLKKEVTGEQIHRVSEIELFSFDALFLAQLASALRRDNSWVMIHTEGEIVITVGDESFVGRLASHRLGA
jgi:uncharacterized protein YaeQ